MRENLTITGDQHVREVRRINRDLIEKALRMRCLGYVAQARAQLLTETIFEIDQSKKTLQNANRTIAEQREFVAEQKVQLEQANKGLRKARDELERRVAERTADLRRTNNELAREIEEREQAEAALRESEARFRALFREAGMGIALVDTEGHPVHSNPALQNMLGYSGEELAQMVFTEFTHPDDADKDMNHYRELMAGERDAYKAEKRYYRKDGELIYADLTVTLFRDAEGQPQFGIAMVEGITERKRAERALRQSKLDLQARNETLAAINAVADRVYRSLDVSTVAREAVDAMMQYSRSPSVAFFLLNEEEECLDLVHSFGFSVDALAKGSRLLLDGSLSGITVARRRVTTSEDMSSDARLEPATGQALLKQGFRMAISVPLLFGDRVLGVMNLLFKEARSVTDEERNTLLSTGKTIGLAVANATHVQRIEREIAERRQAEEALRQSEERYRLLFDNANDGIYVIDPDTHAIIDCNKKAAEIDGYGIDELRGMTVAKLHPEQELSILPEKFHDVAEQGYSLNTITGLNHRRKDGKLIPIEVNAAMFEVSGKRLNLSIVRDVTERVKAEEERQQLQVQLQQAQKMESIGHLTGGIAHDFNNILSIIMGFTSLSRAQFAGDGGGKLAEYLSYVYEAGERARDLVDQMLTFSRGASSEPRALALPAMVKEVAKMLRSTLPSSIDLHTDLDESVPPVMMDPIQLDQLIMNLCINARDAMDGHGQLWVTLRGQRHIETKCSSCHEAVAGEFVELAVRDTGTGIRPEIQKRIFEPFFSTKDVGKGSGMGLPVVHGIMHKHHGHIVTETSPESGTTFRLLFPPAPEAAYLAENSKNVQPRAPEVEHGKHILVVDDEESVARFLKELLEPLGYRVTLATNGGQALAVFKEQPQAIDLLLTDQTMPGTTGAELAQAVLAIRRDLPIILCTGYSDAIEAERATQIGIAGFLAKPVESKKLLELIYELLHAEEDKG